MTIFNVRPINTLMQVHIKFIGVGASMNLECTSLNRTNLDFFNLDHIFVLARYACSAPSLRSANTKIFQFQNADSRCVLSKFVRFSFVRSGFALPRFVQSRFLRAPHWCINYRHTMILKQLVIGLSFDTHLTIKKGKNSLRTVIKSSIAPISSLVTPPSMSFNVDAASIALKLI